MGEFLELVTPENAWQRWLAAIEKAAWKIDSEQVELAAALGRVLAEPIAASEPLPPFERSTVDGFAVRASDTFGASETLPAYLALVGEMPMGAIPPLELGEAQAALVHTGGALPQAADAVVMLEDTQRPNAGELEVFKAVAQGENVLARGEDLIAGAEAFPAGRCLRPQDLGGLAALGITKLAAVRKPRVAIISTGDELVAPGMELRAGQVRDVNSTTLSALVSQAGGEAVPYGIASDSPGKLDELAARAKEECDVIVITAGSSVSARDRTSQVIDGLGAPGVLVHGLTIKPGKPTILGLGGDTPALGLPGNPVSALVIAGLMLTPLLRYLQGQPATAIRPQVPARMAVNIASRSGREDYVPVQLSKIDNGYEAQPVYGRSNLIFTLVRADGLLRIPPEVTGAKAGDQVMINLF